jgi:hypothetical protein
MLEHQHHLDFFKKAIYSRQKTRQLIVCKESRLKTSIVYMRLIQFEHRNFEYVSQKSVIVIWPRIFSTCRKHVSVLSSFMTYHRVCNYVSTTDATSSTGTAYPSGAHAFITGFKWGSCYSIFNFMCIFCRSLFVLLYFIFWSLCWLFFFNLRILITTLVSSNSFSHNLPVSWTSRVFHIHCTSCWP